MPVLKWLFVRDLSRRLSYGLGGREVASMVTKSTGRNAVSNGELPRHQHDHTFTGTVSYWLGSDKEMHDERLAATDVDVQTWPWYYEYTCITF